MGNPSSHQLSLIALQRLIVESYMIDGTAYALGGLYVAALVVVLVLRYFGDSDIWEIPRKIRTLQLLEGKLAARLVLYAAYVLLLLLPAVFAAAQLGYQGTPGVSFFMAQMVFALAVLPLPSILFYPKTVLMIVLLTAAQLLSSFTSSVYLLPQNSFVSITSIFLTFNGTLFCVLLFLRSNGSWNLTEAIDALPDFKKYVSQSVSKDATLLGGFQHSVTNLHTVLRWALMVGVWLLSLGVLVGYSFIVFYTTTLRNLGTIISVAVTTTDIVVMMIVLEKKKINAITLCGVAFLSRLLLIVFGAFYWFVGYCISYILISAYISKMIIDKYHFLHNEVAYTRKVEKDILRYPEFHAIFLNIVFWALNFYLGYGAPPDLPRQIVTIVGNNFQFWTLGVISTLVSVGIFGTMAGFRVLERNLRGLTERNTYYLAFAFAGLHWVYFFIAYLAELAITVTLASISQPVDYLLLACGIFLPPAAILIVFVYFGWKKNGFRVLSNITDINDKIKRQKDLEEKEKQQRAKYVQNLQKQLQNEMKTKGLTAQNSTVRLEYLKKIQSQELQEIELEEQIFDEQMQNLKEDWRLETNAFAAFFKRKLLKSDYILLAGMLGYALVLAGFGLMTFFTVTGVGSRLVGFAIGVAGVALAFILPPLHRNYSTLEDIQLWDALSLGFGLVFHLALGIVYYALTVSTYPTMKGYLVFVLLFPSPIFLTYGCLKFFDEGFNFSKLSIAFLSLGTAFGLAAGILLAVLVNLAAGLALIGSLLYGELLLWAYSEYYKNKSVLPLYAKLAVIGVGAAILIAIIVVAFVVVPGVQSFWVFSVAYLVLTLVLYMVGAFAIFGLEYRVQYFLMFYGADLSECYSYDHTKGMAEKSTNFLRMMLLALLLFQFWTLLVAVFFAPLHVGVALSCAVEAIWILHFLFFSNRTGSETNRVSCKVEAGMMVKKVEESWTKVKARQASAVVKQSDEMEEQLQALPEEDERKKELAVEAAHRRIEEYQICVNLWLQILLRLCQMETERMEEMLNFIEEAKSELGKLDINITVPKDSFSVREKYNKIQKEISELPEDKQFFFNELYTNFGKLKAKREEEAARLKKEAEEQERKRRKEQEEKLREELERQLKLKQEEDERKKREQGKFEEEEAARRAKRQAEEELKKKEEQEKQRKRQAEEELKRKEEQENKRKRQAEEELKRKEEQEKQRKLQEERKRIEEERKKNLTLILAAEEADRIKQLEEQRKKEEELKKKEQELKRQQQEIRRQAQQRRLEQQRKQKEEKARQEQQARQEQLRRQKQEQARQEQLRRQKEEQARQEQLRRQKEEERKKQQNQDVSNLTREQVDKMPAGIQKIQALCKFNQSLYEDPDLPKDSYLDAELRKVVKGWKRPPADMVLLADGQGSGLKVAQGYIGDCYLISAIGVLANYLKTVLGVGVWQNPKGGYMVKFSKYGDPIYVIIDDQFPVYGNDWAFGRSENPKELFVHVIEKSYGKLFGGYKNIVGGHVHEALSVLTGGIPAFISSEDFKNNAVAFYTKIQEYKQLGYLMGASSNPHKDGDRATSPRGVVQGHAYQVLDCKTIDGTQLLKLRNPHGSQGQEWTGDWSDNSATWTARTKALVNDTFGKDGAFWISIGDFMKEFRAISVCKLFSEDSWKIFPTVRSEWKGSSAQGLAGKASNYEKNPQFGLKTSKGCKVVAVLEQQRSEEQFFIQITMQNNKGKRIKANYKNLTVGSSGPCTNTRSVTMECELGGAGTYSIMVATYEAGNECPFIFKLYTDDLAAELIGNDAFV